MSLRFPIQRRRVSEPIRVLASVQVQIANHLYVLINQQSVNYVIIYDMQPDVGVSAWRTTQGCKYMTENITLDDYTAAWQY